MRAAKIIVVIWLLCEVAIWIREGHGVSVLDALPFVSRSQSFSREYDALALGALLIGVFGYLSLPRPQQQQGGRRFRTGILLVPLSIIALAMLSRRLHLTIRFSELLGDPSRLSEHQHLAVLCLAVFAVLLIVKAFRNHS